MILFDLTIYPLYLNAGREQHDLPGLFVTAAPRKAARMRAQDHLLLSMRLLPLGGSGGVNFSPSQHQEMLRRLADTYFSTAGSVTAGLRAVAARLNEFLLNRNLKAGQAGQTLGILNLAAVHGGSVIVAHAGATHTFILSKTQVQHYDDSAAARVASARGLGLARQPVLRFYQSALEAGDLLVACAEPPGSWNTRSLANSPQLSLETVRRRLLSDSSGELQAAVIRFQAGKGLIQYWHPSEGTPQRPGAGRPTVRPAAPAEPAQAEADLTVMATPEAEIPAAVAPVEEPVLQPEESPAPSIGEEAETAAEALEEAAIQDLPGVYIGNITPPHETQSSEAALTPRPPHDVGDSPLEPAVQQPEATMNVAAEVQPAEKEARPSGRTARRTSNSAVRPAHTAPEKPQGPPISEEIRRSLASVWHKGSAARAKTRETFGKVAVILPKRRDAEGNEQSFFNISPSVMLAIAIIVPILVATVALVIFDRIGRADRFELLLGQAQQYAAQAAQQTDPVLKRDSWARVYEQVTALENSYGKNEESAALRNQAIGILDEMEGYVRLNFQPVITGRLPQGTRITRMVATFSDVYLLDSGMNRVLRLYRTGSGYELDANFSCGDAQAAGAAALGQIIDIAPLPPNNERRATVLAVEVGGNLIYCMPNSTAFDSQPLALPDNGWGQITGIYYYNNTLYVLDPKANAIQYYDGIDGGFPDRPHFYFGPDIPQMNDVIDIAVDQEFLYMLHADGRMTLCESAGFAFATAECTDPIPYGDSRPGYEPSPLSFLGSEFTQIITTQPPDPSLYALDAANKSIYHLSLRRLNLQRQYRPKLATDFPLPRSEPTAFTVAPNRWVLMAFDNQVFFAPIP